MTQDTCNLKYGPPGHLTTKKILNMDADKRWAQYPMADQGFSFEGKTKAIILIYSLFCGWRRKGVFIEFLLKASLNISIPSKALSEYIRSTKASYISDFIFF